MGGVQKEMKGRRGLVRTLLVLLFLGVASVGATGAAEKAAVSQPSVDDEARIFMDMFEAGFKSFNVGMSEEYWNFYTRGEPGKTEVYEKVRIRDPERSEDLRAAEGLEREDPGPAAGAAGGPSLPHLCDGAGHLAGENLHAAELAAADPDQLPLHLPGQARHPEPAHQRHALREGPRPAQGGVAGAQPGRQGDGARSHPPHPGAQ